MANKFRVYDEKKNVILDNVATPINIPVEAGKSYAKGAFTWALINEIGEEIQTGEVDAFVAEGDAGAPTEVSVEPASTTAQVSGK